MYAFPCAKPTGQRSFGIPEQNETTFSNYTERTNRNSSCHFYSFSKSLIGAKNQFVKNGTANFGQNFQTKKSGPPPKVIQIHVFRWISNRISMRWHLGGGGRGSNQGISPEKGVDICFNNAILVLTIF